MTISTDLAAARTAAAKQDWKAALHALLAAWRATPAPQIAEAIEKISAHASAGMEPPTATTAKGRNDAWNKLARAGDPVAMGMLCATVAATKGNAETLGRLELLLPHGPDPRLSKKICDWIETPLYNVTVARVQPFWRRVWPLLQELGDPRILERARGFDWTTKELSWVERERLVRRLGQTMPALEAAYGATPIALDKKQLAICAEIAAVVGAQPARATGGAKLEPELLAAIYAAPDDDGPRMVYSDFLQERGDPRGEFIALQIARGTKRGASPRERALVAEYGDKWRAPLPILKTGATFERGFVAGGRATAFDDSPAWATMRRLDEVSSRDIRAIAKLTRPLELRELYWDARSSNDPDTAPAMAAFAKLTTLPRLRRLELKYWQSYRRDGGATTFAWLFRSRVAKQLEELRMLLDPTQIPDVLAGFAKLPLRRLEVIDHGHARYHGFEVTIERDAGGDLAKLTIEAYPTMPPKGQEDRCAALADWLDRAPVTMFSSATLAIPAKVARPYAKMRARFEKALARQNRVD